MPRKPRIEYSGAFYHVITRGNQKQRIFKDILDYEKYLQIAASYKQRQHFRLYAYVLMSNHLPVLAKEYGYRGIEIADYLKKDPTAVTQYARKRDEVLPYIAAVEKVIGAKAK